MRTGIAALLLLLLPVATHAQTKVPPAFLGTWSGATQTPPSGVPPVENIYAELEKNLLTYLQPWALAKHDATEWNIDDTGQVCKLDGIFRPGHQGSGGFRFVEAPGKLYQIFGVDERGLQRVYFDSPHPSNLLPTWNGDSRGHFDGADTLVVDIIGFNDKSWLGSDRFPHSEELHVVERYRLFGNGDLMQLRVFVDDRKALKAPYTYTRYYRRGTEPVQGGESVCNQTPPGENLWRIRRDELLAEHKAGFDSFIARYEGEPLQTTAAAGPLPAAAQAVPAVPIPDAKLGALAGIYEAAPLNAILPGELKEAGTLADLALHPAALEIAKSRDLTLDTAKHCQPIGPFRMMARDGTKFELLTTGNRLTMMFENIALGNKREIYLSRTQHPADMQPTWLGDSIGRWEGDTLVVDTVGFNDMTWLNDAGAPHSDVLHFIERYRLVDGGKYLELQATADDSKALTRPYTYTRYYHRVNTELAEDFCQESN